MVARRQKQLFGATTPTCYMTLCSVFHLILRSQQTQWNSQIKSSYKREKKRCGRYRKIASQVKNKGGKETSVCLVSLLLCYYSNAASKIWTSIALFTAERFPSRKKPLSLQNLWLFIILVRSGSLFRHAKTLQSCQHWVSKSKLSIRAWPYPSFIPVLSQFS